MPQAVLDVEVVKRAVQLACRAPSVHNSQPWHWVPRVQGCTCSSIGPGGCTVPTGPAGRRSSVAGLSSITFASPWWRPAGRRTLSDSPTRTIEIIWHRSNSVHSNSSPTLSASAPRRFCSAEPTGFRWTAQPTGRRSSRCCAAVSTRVSRCSTCSPMTCDHNWSKRRSLPRRCAATMLHIMPNCNGGHRLSRYPRAYRQTRCHPTSEQRRVDVARDFPSRSDVDRRPDVARGLVEDRCAVDRWRHPNGGLGLRRGTVERAAGMHDERYGDLHAHPSDRVGRKPRYRSQAHRRTSGAAGVDPCRHSATHGRPSCGNTTTAARRCAGNPVAGVSPRPGFRADRIVLNPRWPEDLGKLAFPLRYRGHRFTRRYLCVRACAGASG